MKISDDENYFLKLFTAFSPLNSVFNDYSVFRQQTAEFIFVDSKSLCQHGKYFYVLWIEWGSLMEWISMFCDLLWTQCFILVYISLGLRLGFALSHLPLRIVKSEGVEANKKKYITKICGDIRQVLCYLDMLSLTSKKHFQLPKF